MAKIKAPFNRMDRVTIVGGGTAGWHSSAILGTFLNERHDGPPIEINLFGLPSFLSVLYAKGRFDDVALPLEGSIDKADWKDYVESIENRKTNYAQYLARHYDFPTDLRNQVARRLLGFV